MRDLVRECQTLHRLSVRSCECGRRAGRTCAEAGSGGGLLGSRAWASRGTERLHNLDYESLILLLAQVNRESAWKLNESYVGSNSCWQLTPLPPAPPPTTFTEEPAEDQWWGAESGRSEALSGREAPICFGTSSFQGAPRGRTLMGESGQTVFKS